MPHRRSKEPCRRHHYRTRLHPEGCDADSWPHYHVRCRRCVFEWWQPTLLPDMPLTDPSAGV